MNAPARADAAIQHLRLVERQAGLARSVARGLAAAELALPALPPGAILLVRHVAGRVQLAAVHDILPDRWNTALTEVLARCQAQAARPAGGFVPANSAAVWFADEAELLACLCRDWLAGATAQWWWRMLYPQGIDVELLGTTLAAQPGRLPPLLARLQAIGRAVPLLAELPAACVQSLLCGLARHYALAAWQSRCEPLLVRLAEAAPVLAERPAPWQALLVAQPQAGLSPARETLLGLALTLAAQPNQARQPAFAQAARRWLAASLGQTARAVASAPTALQPAPASRPASGSAVAAPSVDSPPSLVAHRSAVERRAAVAPDTATADPATSPSASMAAGDILAENAPLAGPVPSGVPGPASAAAPDATLPALPEAVREPLQTRFGGLFYLINVALSLGLYGDFTQPRRPGWALPPWDFLALLGERLLGPALRDDPLWGLLARLAGRAAGCEPGEGFAPPADWALPDAWRGPAVSHGLAVPPAGLAAWSGWLLTQIAPRLAALLDCPPDALGPRLCGYHATVWLGDEVLDVYLSLDALPIEIRVAGLDRDPGWLPAAARIIRFHFEP